MICPGQQNEIDWLHAKNQLGEVGAERLFKKFEDQPNPDTALRNAIHPSNYTSLEKRKRLEAYANSLRKVENIVDKDGDTIRQYENTSTGKKYTPVSNLLDQRGETVYRGTPVGDQYADKGTEVHKVWEDLVKGIKADQIHADNSNIPLQYIRKASDFVKKLQETGQVLTEMKVSIEGPTNAAGTVDLIHLRDDGVIDIYDVKTVHQTKKDSGAFWTVEGDAYKARRYSSQLMMYGEMVGNILDHPVKNHYIIPAEVNYKNAEDLDNLEISRVQWKDPENIVDYGYTFKARRIVDELLGNKERQDLGVVAKPDVSDTVLGQVTKLSKEELTRERSMKAEAEAILQQSETSDNTAVYHNTVTNKKVAFTSTDRGDRLNQIIRQDIMLQRMGRNDVFASLLSSIKTGEDKLSKDDVTLTKFLSEYRATSFKAEDLSAIEGFESKANWILLRNGDRMDLIYAGNENLNDKLPGSTNKHLLGHHSPQPKQKYGGQLDNTFREYRGLEGTLIALQLLRDNPNTQIGKISLYNENVGTLPLVVNWHKYLDVLQVMNTKKDLAGKAGSGLKSLMETDRERFTTNYLEAYSDFIKHLDIIDVVKDPENLTDDQRKDALRRTKTQVSMENFVKGRFQKEQFKAQIYKDIKFLKGKTQLTPAQQREVELLSAMVLQLEGVDMMDKPIGKIEGKLQSNTLLPGNILDFVKTTVAKNKQAIKDEFLDYNEKKGKLLDSFFKSQGYSKYNPVDKVLSTTTRFYEDLFERRKMVDSSTGKVVTVNSYRLISEDSQMMKDKTGGDKNHPFYKFHQFVKNTIADSAAMAGMAGKWDAYQIPLVKHSVANSLYKIKRGDAEPMEAARTWINRLTDNFEFSDTDQSKEGMFQMSNWFISQTDEKNRNNLLKVSGNEVSDLSTYNTYETNLEKVLDLFLVNGLRMSKMQEVSNVLAAAHTVYDHYAANLYGSDFLNNKQLMEDMNTIIVDNRGLNSGETFDKIATGLNMVATHLTLAGNVKSGLTVLGGQEMLVFSRALSNSMGKTGFFKVPALGKATAMFAKKPRLMNAMVDFWGAQDSDTTSLVSGIRQKGNKSLFNMKTLFSPFVYADRVTKAELLIAAMIEDGSIDAYSYNKETGALTYNEDLDPRFQGNSGKALKNVIKSQMVEDGTLDENGRMTRGYDSKQQERINTEIGLLFGTYERDQKAAAGFSSIGKLLFLHKTFFPSVFARAVSRNMNLSNLGEYVETTNPDGEQTFVWKGGIHEGMLVSLLASARWLKRAILRQEKEPLTDVQRQNLRRITADMITLSIGSAFAYAFAAALGDDEEKSGAKSLSTFMAGAQRDLLVVYNTQTLTDAFKPVALEVTLKAVNTLGDALFATTTEGSPDFFQELLRLPAVTRQLDNIIQQMNVE